MSKIAITGASGLLGNEFLRLFGIDTCLRVPRDLLAPSNEMRLAAMLADFGADVVVNCAAHTDVEGAERDPETDFEANGRLPGRLATICRDLDALIVHVSSTGCYGNWKSEAYVETDPLRPTTAHHRAKAAGEDGVRAAAPRHLILRTGWLFGGPAGGAKNFVWKRIVEARGTTEMTSDATQFGCPTHAGEVAAQVAALLETGPTGTFNVVAGGRASRYDYVRRIVEATGLPCRVSPGPAFRRLAAVSFNETAVNAGLQGIGLDRMSIWQRPLDAYVIELFGT